MNLDFLRFRTARCIVLAIATFSLAHAGGITEAQVFEWWDDGTIEAAEANELLTLLDEGNTQQACILAEIYAEAPCDIEKESDGEDSGKSHAKARRKRKAERNYGGHVAAKVRFDSTGNPESHREELRLTFHRLTLRLGSQELLTYRGKRGEAHFGEISTREIHSAIPLDTLWGTAVAYTLGKSRLSALLDTSKLTSIGLEAGPFPDFTAQASLWYDAAGSGESPSQDISASATFTIPSGKVSAWFRADQGLPLLYFDFRGKDSAFAWSTSGYIHGDSVPAPARLSPSILKSRFWSTQSVTFRAKEFFDTRVSASARVVSPLESDSVSGRFTLNADGGPPPLRIGVRFTCREASDYCRRTAYQGKIESSHLLGNLTAALSGSARTYHDRADASWSRPRLELGASVAEKRPHRQENSFKLSLVAPDAHPGERMQIRTETRASGDFLEVAIAAAFKMEDGQKIRPTHAQISSKISF